MVCDQKNRLDQFDKMFAEQSKIILQLQAEKIDSNTRMASTGFIF